MPRAILSLAAAVAAAGCAYDDYGYRHGAGPYGGYAYEGEEWRHAGERHLGELAGPGAIMLDPWLATTPEGQAVVATGFRSAARGYVDEETAHRANIWFRRYADTDGDLCLTDPEIRVALVQAAGRYLR